MPECLHATFNLLLVVLPPILAPGFSDVISNFYSKPFLYCTVSFFYSILTILLLRAPYDIWCVRIHEISFVTLFLLAFLLLIVFDSPCISLFYHRVCQQQYLLLLLLLLYSRLLTIKILMTLCRFFTCFYESLLSFCSLIISHIASPTFSSSSLTQTLSPPLLLPPFSIQIILTDLIPEGHAQRMKEFAKDYMFLHFLCKEIEISSLCPFFSQHQFISLMPHFFFFLTFCSQHSLPS